MHFRIGVLLCLVTVGCLPGCTWTSYSYRSVKTHAEIGADRQTDGEDIDFAVDPRADVLEFSADLSATEGTLRWKLRDPDGRLTSSGSCERGRVREHLTLDATPGDWNLTYTTDTFSGNVCFKLDAHSN